MSPRPLPAENAAFAPALGLARAGRLEEAIAALATAVSALRRRGPRREAAALAFAEVARLAEAGGDLANAGRALEQALHLAPGFADLHFRRGCLLLTGQQPAAARAAIGEALRINPRYVAARLELALLDAREGFLGEALTALRALEQERSVEAPRAFQQGLRSLQRADWEEAGTLLRSALQVTEPVVERAVAQYETLAAQGEPTRALHVLREAAVAQPNYPDLHGLLGRCELEAGLTDDALASLARALELNPDFHDARVQLARTLEASGDLVQAAEQVAMVLEQDPAHPLALELQARWARRRDPRAPRRPRLHLERHAKEA